MSPFSEGMFGLGYGQPDKPDNEPDPQKVMDILDGLNLKTVESIMQRLTGVAKQLEDTDLKAKTAIGDRLTSSNDRVDKVANRIRTNIGNLIESASVKQSALNNRARADNFDLTAKASELMLAPADSRTTTRLKDKVREWQNRTNLQFDSPSFEQDKSRAISDLRRVVKESLTRRGEGIAVTSAQGFDAASIWVTENIGGGAIPTNVTIWPSGIYVEVSGNTFKTDITPVEIGTVGDFVEGGAAPPTIRPAPTAPIQQQPETFEELQEAIEGTAELPAPGTPESFEFIAEGLGDEQCPGCQMPVCICENEPGEVWNVNVNIEGQQQPTIPPPAVEEVVETVSPIQTTLPGITVEPFCPPPPEEKVYTLWCNRKNGRVFIWEGIRPPPGQLGDTEAIGSGKTPQEARANGANKCHIHYEALSTDLEPAFVRDTRKYCGITAYKDYKLTGFVPRPGQEANTFGAQILGISAGNLLQLIERNRKNYESGATSYPMFLLYDGFYSWVNWLNATLTDVTGLWGSDIAGFAHDMLFRIVMGFLEQWISSDIGYLKQPAIYGSQEKLPFKFPSEIQAMNAFISGEIDADTWGLWTRMNGFCVEPMSKLLNFHRTKFNPAQLLDLLRREVISEDRYKAEFKQWGYMGDGDPKDYETINQFIPPIQDLIHFMVRDVFDVQKRDIYAPNDDFNAKWSAKAKDFGHYQGINSEVAELYWRAHWVIPPTGALYDFYHRQRVRQIPGEPQFTYARLEEALRINDNNPKFIPYMIQASQHLLTRVDVRRAYRLGILNEQDVEDNYLMRGYAPQDAVSLREYAKQDKEQFLLARRETKLYRAGTIGVDEWRRGIARYNPTPQQIQYVEHITSLERRRPLLKKCIKFVEKSFIDNEIDMQQARAQLTALGMAPDNVNEALQGFFCVKRSQPKSLSVSQLGQRFELALITSGVFHDNLVELGYEPVDANRIIDIYVAKRQVKSDKEDAKSLKDIEKSIARTNKQIEADNAKAKRLQERLAKARIKRKQAEDRRELRVLKSIQKLAKCLSVDIEVATSLVKEALYGLETIYNYTSEERTTLIERSVDGCKEYSIEGFNAEWLRVASSFGRLEPLDLNSGSGTSGSNSTNAVQSPGRNGTGST